MRNIYILTGGGWQKRNLIKKKNEKMKYNWYFTAGEAKGNHQWVGSILEGDGRKALFYETV